MITIKYFVKINWKKLFAMFATLRVNFYKDYNGCNVYVDCKFVMVSMASPRL